MITLTTPIQIPNSLGAATTTPYNKLRVRSISVDPVTLFLNATIELMDSSDTTQPTINGTLVIDSVGHVIIELPNINFFRTVTVSGAALNVVQGWMTTLQNSIESGLVSQGLVAGTQTTGV